MGFIDGVSSVVFQYRLRSSVVYYALWTYHFGRIIIIVIIICITNTIIAFNIIVIIYLFIYSFCLFKSLFTVGINDSQS